MYIPGQAETVAKVVYIDWKTEFMLILVFPATIGICSKFCYTTGMLVLLTSAGFMLDV